MPRTVSELVTNAVLQARFGRRVVVPIADRRLRMEVDDYESAPPTLAVIQGAQGPWAAASS